MRHFRVKLLLPAVLAASLAISAGISAAAAAIFTTDSTGTTVNQNLFAALQDVYLNGGPQNQNAAGLLDGFYYFQVTDPNGGTLLSLDPIASRALTVANGVVSGVGGSGGTHAVGSFNPNNLSTPVQLFPYSLTPNVGGVYKVWLTPVADYDAGPGSVFGFKNNKSLTDNFKVDAPLENTSPVPEPSTIVLSALGLTAVLRRRSRRFA